MEKYYIVTFESTHHALKFEKVLKGNGVALTLLPVPRRISSSCGIAARFTPETLGRVKELILGQDLMIDALYLFEQAHKKIEFYPVDLNNEEE